MYARRVSIALCLGATVFVSAVAFAAPAKDEYKATVDQTLPLTAGGKFTLDNRNGRITIDTWDKDEIHIVAEKRMRPNNGSVSWLMRLVGLKEDETATDEQALKLFEELKVEIGGDASSRTITTHYPNVQGVEFDVTYHITAPRRVAPTIDTVNSTVEMSDVEGDASIETTNGTIRLSGITGTVHASSTNGRLNLEDISGEIHGDTTNGAVSVVTRKDAPISGPISLESVNGSVNVTVPANASFNVELRTVNGSTSCELPLATKQEEKRKRLEGTVGAGGPLIELRTVNGSVHVKSAT